MVDEATDLGVGVVEEGGEGLLQAAGERLLVVAQLVPGLDPEVPGRQEIIRAIAVGLYDVDPVTRRVFPSRTITAASLSRLATRLLNSRGAACARNMSSEQVLQACGVTDPMTTMAADETIPGRTASAILEQIEAAMTR